MLLRASAAVFSHLDEDVIVVGSEGDVDTVALVFANGRLDWWTLDGERSRTSLAYCSDAGLEEFASGDAFDIEGYYGRFMAAGAGPPSLQDGARDVERLSLLIRRVVCAEGWMTRSGRALAPRAARRSRPEVMFEWYLPSEPRGTPLPLNEAERRLREVHARAATGDDDACFDLARVISEVNRAAAAATDGTLGIRLGVYEHPRLGEQVAVWEVTAPGVRCTDCGKGLSPGARYTHRSLYRTGTTHGPGAAVQCPECGYFDADAVLSGTDADLQRLCDLVAGGAAESFCENVDPRARRNTVAVCGALIGAWEADGDGWVTRRHLAHACAIGDGAVSRAVQRLYEWGRQRHAVEIIEETLVRDGKGRHPRLRLRSAALQIVAASGHPRTQGTTPR